MIHPDDTNTYYHINKLLEHPIDFQLRVDLELRKKHYENGCHGIVGDYEKAYSKTIAKELMDTGVYSDPLKTPQPASARLLDEALAK